MPTHSSLSPLLITAGPTYEPIDAVRFIGNRSSGRVGVELAKAAIEAGHEVTLLLGPGTVAPPKSLERQTGRVIRFQSSRDLERLLDEQWRGAASTLIMAAAVADFRMPAGSSPAAKLERTAAGLSLQLEPTPDLVAGCCARRRPGQRVIGFALEPAATLAERAGEKLRRKGLDAIVANPLETMDAPEIDAALIWADGQTERPGRNSKPAFARWLIQRLARTTDADA